MNTAIASKKCTQIVFSEYTLILNTLFADTFFKNTPSLYKVSNDKYTKYKSDFVVS